jgi:hypothetical protein
MAATVDAIPLSKGWLSMDRANVSYAMLATIATALARTYAVGGEGKVLDVANAAIFPLFLSRDKLDDVLFKQTQARYLGDVACGAGAFVIARSFLDMSTMTAAKYGAVAASLSILTRYALQDENLLKI